MMDLELLFEQADRIREAEDAADAADTIRERYSEGIVGMEWHLCQHPRANVALMPYRRVIQLLGDVQRFAATGGKSAWLEKALGEVR